MKKMQVLLCALLCLGILTVSVSATLLFSVTYPSNITIVAVSNPDLEVWDRALTAEITSLDFEYTEDSGSAVIDTLLLTIKNTGNENMGVYWSYTGDFTGLVGVTFYYNTETPWSAGIGSRVMVDAGATLDFQVDVKVDTSLAASSSALSFTFSGDA